MPAFDGEFYLQRHEIHAYLSDVVAQLIAERHERPIEAVAAYFERALAGTHVLHREFAFVAATPHNRRSFCRLLAQALRPLDAHTRVTADELCDLARLLCEDLPVDVARDACARAHATEGRPRAAEPLPLSTALLALCTQLTYADFVTRALEVFRACDTRANGIVNRTVVCLTLRQMMAAHSWTLVVPAPRVLDELLADVRAPGALAHTADERGSSAGAPGEWTAAEFETRLFGACMAHMNEALALALPGGAGGGGAADEEADALRRRKAEIRARWARRRSAGTNTLAFR
ncbi:hypothetical protein KFE25_011443 [Diacronema lutheri]|uniref:Centriolar satellite-associated tubulin polyglutamylase complex regulator 1 n=1 Tax=Diacronema lutheri TaxID=2081491 RepID=A0A8J5X6U0_DIALT|nr:hypothetical protein KFE25_011443 [Diacronema lutheri]